MSESEPKLTYPSSGQPKEASAGASAESPYGADAFVSQGNFVGAGQATDAPPIDVPHRRLTKTAASASHTRGETEAAAIVVNFA